MGAKETTVPKKYKSFKEMSVKDPDIAKYFNESDALNGFNEYFICFD